MTSVSGFEARASIERQAREWLIRLDSDGPLTHAEVQALHAWLDSNPLHREEIRRLSRFWSEANVLTELAVSLRREAAEPVRPRGRRMQALLATSGVLASIILWYAWWQQSDLIANGSYATAIGQQQTISLPDGSSIQLNTDSQLEIQYSEGRRRIQLLRGEALFDVRRDARRDFEVHADRGLVRAVGTAFSVQLDGSRINVTVTKGIVDVGDLGSVTTLTRAEASPAARRPPPRTLGRLTAGQTTTFSSGAEHIDVRELAEPELANRLAWHEGYLVFAGERLDEVVAQVNRYSPVRLTIADPKIASIAVGGRFRIGDLDAVLAALHTNFGVQSTEVDDNNIRLESAGGR